MAVHIIMRMKLYRIYALLMFAVPLLGQQGPQSSLMIFNPYTDHSSLGGMERSLSINGQLRSQWTNFGNGPNTQYLGANMPVYAWNGAVGADLYTYSAGNLRTTQMRFSYNYVTGFMGGLISGGLRLGINQLRLDGSKITTPDGSYEDNIINHNDPVLTAGFMNSFGVNWEISGAYTNNLFTAAVSFADLVSPNQSLGDAKFRFDRTVYGMFRYDYALNDEILLMPNVAFRTNLRVIQTDLGIIGQYRMRTMGGLMLRGYSGKSIDALAIIAGYQLSQKVSLYYSYEAGLSPLRYTNEGSHDFILKIRMEPLFGKNLPPRIIYNPRFL